MLIDFAAHITIYELYSGCVRKAYPLGMNSADTTNFEVGLPKICDDIHRHSIYVCASMHKSALFFCSIRCNNCVFLPQVRRRSSRKIL